MSGHVPGTPRAMVQWLCPRCNFRNLADEAGFVGFAAAACGNVSVLCAGHRPRKLHCAHCEAESVVAIDGTQADAEPTDYQDPYDLSP